MKKVLADKETIGSMHVFPFDEKRMRALRMTQCSFWKVDKQSFVSFAFWCSLTVKNCTSLERGNYQER